MKSVTVITSSIGRPELRQCVESVAAQTYGGLVRHHVYVNGERFWGAASDAIWGLEITPPALDFFDLREETGDYGMGPSMADVFAAAPFLTRSDWIFFLNDDDFYDPNHISSVMEMVERHDLAWGYSLRKFVTIDGKYICDDDWNSLGAWPCLATPGEYLVDNSCFAVSRPLACRLAQAWTFAPFVADRCFLAALKETGVRYGCTGLSTVNYRLGTGTATNAPEAYLNCAREFAKVFPEGFPWRRESVFNLGAR